MSEQDKIRQPARVIVGHCPACRAVLVIENNYEVWPYIRCGGCEWHGDTLAVANSVRYERDGVVA